MEIKSEKQIALEELQGAIGEIRKSNPRLYDELMDEINRMKARARENAS